MLIQVHVQRLDSFFTISVIFLDLLQHGRRYAMLFTKLFLFEIKQVMHGMAKLFFFLFLRLQTDGNSLKANVLSKPSSSDLLSHFRSVDTFSTQGTGERVTLSTFAVCSPARYALSMCFLWQNSL